MPKKITFKFTPANGEPEWTRTVARPSPPQDEAEKRLRSLNTRLSILYQQAIDDLYAKQADWVEKHQKRVERYRREVNAGLLSQRDFDAWMQGQLFQERQWELKRGQLARLMQDVDRQALRLLNGETLEIFGDNADWMNYKIEQTTGVMVTFGLFSAEAVARLIVEDPNLLPPRELDDSKSYRWYNEIIQNAVIHGIIQGETLDQIAKRVSEETGEKAINVLRRNARTAFTGAMNAGELYSMRRARDEYGVNLQKRWMATLDAHTRDAHADLDGQVQDIDEPFESLLGEIMYPGDPDAEPANVWNCRCYMDEFYPDYDNARYRYDAEGNFVGDVSYEEWRASKMEED